MVSKEEIDEFLIRFAGAMTGGLEDAGLQSYAMLTEPGSIGKFPWYSPHPNLPTYDDMIVGGLAIPPWVIGALMEVDAKKKGDTKTAKIARDVKMFGEGDAIYSLNMLLNHTILRIPRPMWWPPEESGIASPVGGRQAPPQPRQSDVGHVIVQL